MKKPSLYRVKLENSKAIHYAGDIATKTICGVRLKGMWSLTLGEVTCPRCKKRGG